MSGLRRDTDPHNPVDLELFFQPIVSCDGQRTVGAEALLRWHHRELGDISPQRFVPVAEACGLILPLGRWVLRRACQVAAGWSPATHGQSMHTSDSDNGKVNGKLMVNVNVSTVQLQDERFVPQVIDTLEQTGLAPDLLCLEITESAVLHDFAIVRQQLSQLRELGISVALDDFGTAYSSLTWLQQLPLTTLKIDRTFVAQLGGSHVDEAIVTGTITLARQLGLRTIGEGVETREQLHALTSLGCDFAQGYSLSHPLPEPAFAAWLGQPAGV